MTTLKVMDLFCGTGGFSKGFENSGHFEVIFGIDLLKSSVETFRLNHAEALGLAADIRNVDLKDLKRQLGPKGRNVDLIIGGPPCQGFSSIRPHRSSRRDDPRNSLFNQFAEYVHFFRPSAFVLENVVGLATYRDGKTLREIQDAFEDLGYESDWRILNAAHYGVPQKRERLILIGAEHGSKVSFPVPTHDGDWSTIGFRDSSRMLLPPEPSLFTQDVPNLAPAITVANAIDDLPRIASGEGATAYDRPARTKYQRARRSRTRKLELHSSTRHTPKMLEIIKHSGPNISCIPKHLITSGFSSCYSRLAADEPAVTITVNFVHPASNRCIHPTLDRALTPREGARLQSFDDDFKFAGTRTQIVKQIGNAVPPLLGKAIAECLAHDVFGVSRKRSA